jgi:hypothetical protein
MKSQNTKNTSPVNDAELLKTTISLIKRTMALHIDLNFIAGMTGHSGHQQSDGEINEVNSLANSTLASIIDFCNTYDIEPFQVPEQPTVPPGNEPLAHYLAPLLDKFRVQALKLNDQALYMIDHADQCTLDKFNDKLKAEMSHSLTDMDLLIKDLTDTYNTVADVSMDCDDYLSWRQEYRKTKQSDVFGFLEREQSRKQKKAK